MLRVIVQLPKQESVRYQYLDIIHDALIAAWLAAGAKTEDVYGHTAKPWTFAALGWNKKQDRESYNFVQRLVISTPSPELAKHLLNITPEMIKYARVSTLESVNFELADIQAEPDPILPQQSIFAALCLSPFALSYRNQQGRRWHQYLNECDLNTAINTRLSRLAGRKINLDIQADSLYLRSTPDHSRLVPFKKDKRGRVGFVIGMSAPLVLQGSEEDLRFAWYAGIGEKNRSGFGCLGSID